MGVGIPPLSPGPSEGVLIPDSPTDLGSSTELIALKPWCTGKQLPLGLSVFGQRKDKILW